MEIAKVIRKTELSVDKRITIQLNTNVTGPYAFLWDSDEFELLTTAAMVACTWFVINNY